MNTSYRYEIERPGDKTLRKALERQEQRIKVSKKKYSRQLISP